MQSIINIYMHDHRTGLQRGVPGPMICATIQVGDEGEGEKRTNEAQPDQKTEANVADTSINAATKGGKKNEKGQQKGYGQCWECGEYGHPRRECRVYFERMGKGTQQDLSALKGAGKYGKGGKWSKGKGKGTKGKGYYGSKGKGYRSPGKAIGKGFNH